MKKEKKTRNARLCLFRCHLFIVTASHRNVVTFFAAVRYVEKSKYRNIDKKVFCGGKKLSSKIRQLCKKIKKVKKII